MKTAVASPSVPSRANHVLALDGLRAAAIIPVLLIHMGLIRGGNLGVVFFFVLSGFLIGCLLIDERQRTHTINLRAFYVRRVARLYPALLLSLILAFVAAMIIGETSFWVMVGVTLLAATYTGNLFSSITGTWLPMVNYTWTLAQEEQFYLVAPWFIRKVDFAKMTRWALILIAAAVVVAGIRLAVLLAFPEAWTSVYVNPLLNADGMLWGLAIALAYYGGGAAPRRLMARTSTTTIAVIAFAVYSLLAIGSSYAAWTNALAIPVTIVAAVVIVNHLTNYPTSWISTFLTWRSLRWIGVRAYGLYLFHFPIFQVLQVSSGEHSTVERAVRIAIALAVSFGLTAASFAYLERPVGRWIRTFQTRRAADEPLPSEVR